MQFDRQEYNTLAAALEFYSWKSMGEPANRPDHVHNLAIGGEDVDDISLDSAGVHKLLEKVKAGPTQELAFKSVNPHMWKDMLKRFPGITPLGIFIFTHILTYEERVEYLKHGKWPQENTGSDQKIHDLKRLLEL